MWGILPDPILTSTFHPHFNMYLKTHKAQQEALLLKQESIPVCFPEVS